MADKKISELNSILGSLTADDDLLVIVDSSTNETKKITKAELASTINAALIDGAPAALDTLNELAAALADDANFASTVTNSIATKVSKSGDTMTGNLNFGDNNKAQFGASNDLQIYHDGSHSFILDDGTGNLYLRSSNEMVFQDASGNDYMRLIDEGTGGRVELKKGTSTKLTTTSTGVDVNGTVTADGLTVDGSTVIKRAGTGVAATIGAQGYTNNPVFRVLPDETSNAVALGVLADVSYPTLHIQNLAKNRISVGTNGDISFYEDTGTTPKFFWDASAERLGIGTSSPSSALHLQNSTAPRIEFGYGGVSNADHRIAWDGSGFVLSADQSNQSSGNSYMRFDVDGSEAMRIDSSGNVGIGTASPNEKAEISSTDAAVSLRVNTANSGVSASNYSEIQLSDNGQVRAYWRNIRDGSGQTAFSYNDHLSLQRLGSEAMRIDSSGNVGIGTSSPQQKLSIDSAGATNAYIHLKSGDGNLAGIWMGDQTSDYVALVAYDNATNHLQFNANSAERMRIDSSGNLLVGHSTADTYNTTDGVEAQASGLLTATRNGAIAAILNRRTSDGDIAVFRKDGSTVGSIGVRYSNLYAGRGTSGLAFNNTGLDVHPFNPSTLNDSDAQIDLGISTSRFKDLYLSGGVYLGGTGSANHLDDYEEGTWTPDVRGNSTNGVASYSDRNGRYTKVGNLVTVEAYVLCNFTTAPSGALQIAGLPFQSAGDSTYPATQSAIGRAVESAYFYVENNATYLTLAKPLGVNADLSAASIGTDVSNTRFQSHFTIQYRTA